MKKRTAEKLMPSFFRNWNWNYWKFLPHLKSLSPSSLGYEQRIMLLPFCSGSGSSFFSCIFLPFIFLLSTVEHSATTTPLPLLSTSYNQQNHYYRWLTLDAAQKFVDELSMNEANKEAAPTRGKDRRNSTPIITGGVNVYTCRERERREEWEEKSEKISK